MATEGEQMLPCPGVETFLDARDDLYLLPIAGRDQLRIPAPLGRPVWERLRGGPARTTLHDHGAAVAEVLAWLVAEGYVRPRERVTSPATERWDRQVRWLAQESGDGPARQERLRDASVVVVGMGGLGSVVASLLARAGIGTLVIVDHDHVELRNLPRQLLYEVADVGRRKVEAAADRLRGLDGGLRVEAIDLELRGSSDAHQLLAAHDADLVVCAADRPPISIKSWIEDAAAASGSAVVHGGHRPPLCYAGPFFIPGLSCCYECFSRSRTVPGAEALESELAAYRDLNPPELPAVGWGDTAAASLIVGQSVQWLAGLAEPILLGRELELDLVTLQSRFIDGPELPQCRRCDPVLREVPAA